MKGGGGRWRWLVLVAAAFNLMCNASVSYHLGVLNLAVLDTYQSDFLMTAWLLSIYGSLYGLVAPLGSVVINATNCRTCVCLSGILSCLGFVASSFVTKAEWLFLTINIAGIGQSFCLVGGSVALAFYFPDTMAIASGIVMTGAGIGCFVHPAMLQVLVDEYGLRGGFLILGGMGLNSCVAGLIFRPTELERKLHTETKHRKEGKRALDGSSCRAHLNFLTDPAFAMFLLSFFTFSVAFTTVTMYLPDYLVNFTVPGFSRQEASVVASLIGVGPLASRILVGFAASDPKIGQVTMFAGLNAVSGLLCFLEKIFFRFHTGAYLFSFGCGIYANTVFIFLTPLTFHILGHEKGATGCGLVLMAAGVGSLFGPPISAMLVENIGYKVLFPFCGSVFFLAAASGVMTSIFTKAKNPPESITIDIDDSKNFLQNNCDITGAEHNSEALQPMSHKSACINTRDFEGNCIQRHHDTSDHLATTHTRLLPQSSEEC